MKKSTKAVLLSAFVLPGLGHFLVKKYFAGAVLAGAALAALYVYVSGAVAQALQITEMIERGELQPDVAVITELVSRQPVGADARLINIAWAVLIITWLIGIVDSYRVGRLLENEAATKQSVTRR
jgi:hypothetical protein